MTKPGYDTRKKRAAKQQAEQSAAGRDIGSTPAIANVRRRNRCRNSLRLFCETYNPATFYWGWSADHLEIIEAIEGSVFKKALLAFAMPRGSGKTAICRMAILWAVSFAHVDYAFLVGANESKATENLDALKLWMRYLDPYVEDFPEISHASRALGGIANRAAGQTQDGESTLIRWEGTRIVLPRVKKPPNMRWHKGKNSPTSGTVIGVSGLTGEGIRGSLYAHPDGRQIRPKLVLLDDPQTDESAGSLTQNRSRLNLIQGAVLGMAGPGQRISAVMPCTVIKPGDMADVALDRRRSPAWRGVRRKLLRSMPANMAQWEKYFDVYRSAISQNSPSMDAPNAYYLANRKMLDEGAEASWSHRKADDEVSAIQHAMNLYCERGKEAFWAEFQNEPLDQKDERPNRLTPDLVLAKLNGLPRGVVPKDCQWLTAHVDMHDRLLYWTAAAWSATFGGGPLDYGTYPKQPIRYFAQQSAPVAMADVHQGLVEEAWLTAGLTALVDQLAAATFTREDGLTMRISKIGVDSRWKKELVFTFCRRHPRADLLVPTMGHFIGAASKPFDEYRPEPGARSGLHWRIAPPQNGQQYLLVDVNWWKTQASARLALPKGTPGGWEISGGSDPRDHALLADHYCAEEPIEVTAKGRTVQEWKWKPGRPDNHWWDNLVIASALGSLVGAQIPGMEARPRRSPGERPSLAQMAGRKP